MKPENVELLIVVIVVLAVFGLFLALSMAGTGFVGALITIGYHHPGYIISTIVLAVLAGSIH
jgi:hypothetical protein